MFQRIKMRLPTPLGKDMSTGETSSSGSRSTSAKNFSVALKSEEYEKAVKYANQLIQSISDTLQQRGSSQGVNAQGGHGGENGQTPQGPPKEEDKRIVEEKRILHNFLEEDIFFLITKSLPHIKFQERKDFVSLFEELIKLGRWTSTSTSSGTEKQGQEKQQASGDPSSASSADLDLTKEIAKYFTETRPELIDYSVESYRSSPSISLNYGIVLRRLACYPEIQEYVLQKKLIYELMEIARSENFDLASDSFFTIKTYLTEGERVRSAQYVSNNFDEFFSNFHTILLNDKTSPGGGQTDENNLDVCLDAANLYVCQRQSLKLLSDMLLDRQFMHSMLRYISSDHFLKTHMCFLRSSSKTIQFEAFHVFKIFAANPGKTPRITRILEHNKEKLITFFQDFLSERNQTDSQFLQDKQTVIAKLNQL